MWTPFAENGEWISYPFMYPSTGYHCIAVGKDCIGVVKTVSDTLFFFNIITLPKTLVQGLWNNTFTILVDGKPPTYIQTLTDETYIHIYFTYAYSEREVTLIPEFSMSILLLALTGLTLLEIMLGRGKHKNFNSWRLYCFSICTRLP